MHWNREAVVPALYPVHVREVVVALSWEGEAHPLLQCKVAEASIGLLGFGPPSEMA